MLKEVRPAFCHLETQAILYNIKYDVPLAADQK